MAFSESSSDGYLAHVGWLTVIIQATLADASPKEKLDHSSLGFAQRGVQNGAKQGKGKDHKINWHYLDRDQCEIVDPKEFSEPPWPDLYQSSARPIRSRECTREERTSCAR